jgi:hypothetical protein
MIEYTLDKNDITYKSTAWFMFGKQIKLSAWNSPGTHVYKFSHPLRATGMRFVLTNPDDVLDNIEVYSKGAMCHTPPTAMQTGYIIDKETNLGKDLFSVQVHCDYQNGYQPFDGGATAVPCEVGQTPYKLEGCRIPTPTPTPTATPTPTLTRRYSGAVSMLELESTSLDPLAPRRSTLYNAQVNRRAAVRNIVGQTLLSLRQEAAAEEASVAVQGTGKLPRDKVKCTMRGPSNAFLSCAVEIASPGEELKKIEDELVNIARAKNASAQEYVDPYTYAKDYVPKVIYPNAVELRTRFIDTANPDVGCSKDEIYGYAAQACDGLEVYLEACLEVVCKTGELAFAANSTREEEEYIKDMEVLMEDGFRRAQLLNMLRQENRESMVSNAGARCMAIGNGKEPWNVAPFDKDVAAWTHERFLNVQSFMDNKTRGWWQAPGTVRSVMNGTNTTTNAYIETTLTTSSPSLSL